MANSSSLVLKPDAVIFSDGRIQPDIEICIEQGRISEIRPRKSRMGKEDGLLLSAAFVNAHSHLEYYDCIGRWKGIEYWRFIQEITEIKPQREHSLVLKQAKIAAQLQLATGISAIGEWMDWNVSVYALEETGLDGRLFQEVLTGYGNEHWENEITRMRTLLDEYTKKTYLPITFAPHAPFTVHPKVFEALKTENLTSIHVAEHPIENEFFRLGKGPIAEAFRKRGIHFEPLGCSSVEYLDSKGFLKPTTQLVHVCDVSREEIELLASRGVTVAHCPRSNENLLCPPAPVGRMREKGITVGLGLDSAATSGEIDMFAEMRAALRTSIRRGEPLTPEDVWTMATTEGAKSIFLARNWNIERGGNPDLILINPGNARNLEELIQFASPRAITKLIRLKTHF